MGRGVYTATYKVYHVHQQEQLFMGTKLSKLKERMAAGDYRAALRIASQFQELGTQKNDIMRGWDALQRPNIWKEMGYDPDELYNLAIQAIKERYEIQ